MSYFSILLFYFLFSFQDCTSYLLLECNTLNVSIPSSSFSATSVKTFVLGLQRCKKKRLRFLMCFVFSRIWMSCNCIWSTSQIPVCAFSLCPSGVDFKMKTLEIDGVKVRIQIWWVSERLCASSALSWGRCGVGADSAVRLYCLTGTRRDRSDIRPSPNSTTDGRRWVHPSHGITTRVITLLWGHTLSLGGTTRSPLGMKAEYGIMGPVLGLVP